MVRVGQLVYIQAQLSVSFLGALRQVSGYGPNACVPAPGLAMYTVVLATPLWSCPRPRYSQMLCRRVDGFQEIIGTESLNKYLPKQFREFLVGIFGQFPVGMPTPKVVIRPMV